MSSRSIRITGGPNREEAYVDGTKNALKVTGDLSISPGSSTEVIQATADNLNANANLQVGDTDVDGSNPVPVEPGTGSCFPIEACKLLDTTNSSSTPLGSSAAFTGTARLLDGYESITVLVYADQNSAANGLRLELSTDGTNWDLVTTKTVNVGVAKALQLSARAQYFRVVYTNGSVAQGTFRLQTILHPMVVGRNLQVNDEDVGQSNPVTVLNPGGTPLTVIPDGAGIFAVQDLDKKTEGSINTPGSDKVGMAGFERDDNLDNIAAGTVDGDATWGRVDAKGALWVRQAEMVSVLSGSSNGRPINVSATGSPGTTVHVVGSAAELLWLYATNRHTLEVTVTIQFGNTATSDYIILKIPAGDTRPIVTGQPLQGSLTIRAFASVANVVNVSGHSKPAL